MCSSNFLTRESSLIEACIIVCLRLNVHSLPLLNRQWEHMFIVTFVAIGVLARFIAGNIYFLSAFLIIHVLGMQAKIGGRALTKEWIMPQKTDSKIKNK